MKKKVDYKSIYFKRILFVIYDIIAVNFSYFMVAYLTEGRDKYYPMQALLERAIPVTVLFFVLYWAMGVYKSMWEYAGSKELFNVGIATFLGGLLGVAVDVIGSNFGFATNLLNQGTFSVPFYVFGTMLILFLNYFMRAAYRILRRHQKRKVSHPGVKTKTKRAMIVGAGEMGMIIIQELESGISKAVKPVVAVDDDPCKLRRTIRGIHIRGTCDEIPEIANKYNIDIIILCLPSANSERRVEILKSAVKTGCKVQTSPSLAEIIEGKESTYKIRDVEITDLLSRPEVKLDSKICEYVKNQVILVTGGGGSIGSELCRQLSVYSPSKIIIFDIYENNAYVLQNQLERKYGNNPKFYIRIGSVRDKKRIKEVFEEFHPDIVFHAAAHKHVPLMEENPKEAIKNNVFGTYNLAEIACEYKVKRFVSISTDKAVNPTNVMGATKRITELIIQYFGRKTDYTKFAAVRFGNVLGSSGSVIPLFKEEIAAGGPVTVTDPEIQRYFMTIPEAAQLVVQAGGMANGGEIFVLDMGEPVKILSLAENLISLSGLKPYDDIDIIFTGLRPGEKLYEELALEEEGNERRMTANNKIFVTMPLGIDDDVFEKNLARLKNVTDENVRSVLKEIVPNFKEQTDN